MHTMHNPLNCSTQKARPFVWILGCQARVNMIQQRFTNTLTVQLHDSNNPFLLFTDASKFCYSGVLT